VKLPSYKEIIDLLKKGATLEAQEKILELRKLSLELQEENIELREKILSLEQRIKQIEDFEGEPCPRCRKPAWVLESSEPDKTFGELGGLHRIYKCSECGSTESQLITPK